MRSVHGRMTGPALVVSGPLTYLPGRECRADPKEKTMEKTYEIKPMSLEQVERRARELRAEAAHDLAVAFGRGLRRAFATLGTVFAGRKAAHA